MKILIVIFFCYASAISSCHGDLKLKSIHRYRKLSADIISDNQPQIKTINNVGQEVRGNRALCFLISWLYFMAISLNIPNMPRYVNSVVNKGNLGVTPESQATYGMLSSVDSLFTFLSVNAVGCLSDAFGRKPFLCISSLGLGLAYFISSTARSKWVFLVAACVDGLTSSMFSQAQSYITDCTPIKDIGGALGRFQGISIGLSFMLGIPIGGMISKISTKIPLYLAISFCLLSALLTTLFLPESLTVDSRSKRPFSWTDANPVGALRMLSYDSRLACTSLVYFLLNFSQSGVQVLWVNYMQHRFGWDSVQSGACLMLVGLVVAVLPQIIISAIGVENTVACGLLTHALSVAVIGAASKPWMIIASMPFLSAGASTMPVILGYMSSQVGPASIGALQGAADTIRTISAMLACPTASAVFGYFVRHKELNLPGGAYLLSAVYSLGAFLLFTATLLPSRPAGTDKNATNEILEKPCRVH